MLKPTMASPKFVGIIGLEAHPHYDRRISFVMLVDVELIHDFAGNEATKPTERGLYTCESK